MGDVSSPSVVCFDPKKGDENFARLCQLLMTICSDILRDILSHYIKPANLRVELDMNQSKLDRITNSQEKELLFPPHSSTTSSPPIRSKDLDISLLYKILRNICNIPKHRAGWGNPPDSGDYTLSACIERIRLLRNSISGHSTNGMIDDAQFEDYWQELKTSVSEMEKDVIGSDKYERGIDHLHDCDLNPTKAKEYVAQICRIRGEVAIKRERIDMVENTCIEIGEEIDAKRVRLDRIEKSVSDMKEMLTATKDEILREMKSELQKINESKNTNTDRIPISDFKNIEKSTTIKFKGSYFCSGMGPTVDNCWLSFNSSLYLLNDSNVITKVDIPAQYNYGLKFSNITTNDKGEAVFISGRSMIAVTQDGTLYKLFDFPFFVAFAKLCFLHSGKYITVDLFPLSNESTSFGCLSLREYGIDGVPLRTVTTAINNIIVRDIRENFNGDIVFASSDQTLNGILVERGLLINVLAAADFSLKHRVSLPEHGVVVPCMNSRSELLYGHGKTIDLLTSSGQIVKTVYTTNRDTEIKSIASSGNGTVWILYGSHEVEIIKLEF